MNTKYIVRAVWGGTGKNIRISAKNPIVAFGKALNSRMTKGASCFLVFERKTGHLIHTVAVR